MLKKIYIVDLLDNKKTQTGNNVELLGWIKHRRHHGNLLFLHVTDSTGTIQVKYSTDSVTSEILAVATTVPVESAIKIKGKIVEYNGRQEISGKSLEIISVATLGLSPQPRAGFDIFDVKYADHIAKNKAVYLREPHYMAILKFRAKTMKLVREWFSQKHFMEFDAPILVLAPLYDDSTAMGITIRDQNAFLSQCAGFYLEAAAMAFERVYNMGPSFRGEESRSKRHLKEYWHIKAELAFGDRDDIIYLVEDLIGFLYRNIPIECKDEMEILDVKLRENEFLGPFTRISYEDAVSYVRSEGSYTALGLGISTKDEELLAQKIKGPFWIMGIPRSVEPFPYVIDENNPDVTKVADLIAPRGYGEICGVAEKIFNPEMLAERMLEKGKLGDPRYKFVDDVHRAGCVPHIAFGMGFERILRWLLDIPHVRDTIPFPRSAGRRIEH